MRITWRHLVVGLALTLCAGVAAAESDSSATSAGEGGQQYLYPDQRAFWNYGGIEIGRGDYDLTCFQGYSCSSHATGLRLYAGGRFNEFTGLEGSYFYLGNAHFGGGRTWGQGLGLSLVGTLPLTDALGLDGRIGPVFGWTRVDGSAPGMATGNDNGLGFSYGTGLTYAVSNNLGLRLDWDRYRLPFADGRHDVDLATVGLQFSY